MPSYQEASVLSVRKLIILLTGSLLASAAWAAAPALTVQNISGTAGSPATFNVDMNTNSNSVTGLSFDITLPPTLTTMTITLGSVPTAAGKSMLTSLNGNTWSFSIQSFSNANAIGDGTLVSAQVSIDPSATGTVPLAISNVRYTDVSGSALSGTGVSGAITLSGGTGGGTPPSISAFTASPASITSGQSSTLNWTVANATSVVINQGVGDVTALASKIVSPTVTTLYTMTAYGTGGAPVTNQVTVTVTPATPPPSISAFTATPASITSGQSSTLNWTVANATSVVINQGVGDVTALTSKSVSPTVTTLYTMTAYGIGGAPATRTATVTVTAPVNPKLTIPNVTGTAGSPVNAGINFNTGSAQVTGIEFDLALPASLSTMSITGSAALTGANATPQANVIGSNWHFAIFSNTLSTIPSASPLLTAQMLIAAGASGTIPLNLSNVQFFDNLGANVTPGTSTNGTLTVSGGTGGGTPPSISAFTASPASIASGQTSTLNWTVANATSVVINQGVGDVTALTSKIVSPTVTTLYTMTAYGTGGAPVTRTATVTVTPPPSISAFTATPATIVSGQSSVLRWTVANATSVVINAGVGDVTALTSKTVNPSATITYTMTAWGTGGAPVTRQVTLTVTPVNPILAIPNVSGTAGSPVNVGINFNTGSAQVTGIEFDLALPASLSTMSITASAALTGANATPQANVIGSNWHFAIFSNTLSTIPSGSPLLTAQMLIAAGTSGTVPLNLSNVQFFDNLGANVTPGTSTNGTLTVSGGTGGTVAAPTFTPGAGTFTTSVQVSLQSSTSGAFIYYTLDGSNPSLASTLYSGPILLTSNTTIKAFAYKPGLIQSAVVSAAYTLTGNPTLPPPNLDSIPDHVTLNDMLSLANAAAYSNVTFTWSFDAIPSIYGPSSKLAIPANALQIQQRTTSAQTAPLSSYGLPIGSYRLTVQVTDNSNPLNTQSKSKSISVMEADFSAVRVFPNPWRSDRHTGKNVTFDHMPFGSTVKVFTVSGHLVKTLTTNVDTALWNLTNDSGDKVASGIYLYLIQVGGGSGYSSSDQKTTGKLLVIK
jgi:hypothetical protein